jgi:leader peptidase (prepilin peptidase)/N-methyltransferase
MTTLTMLAWGAVTVVVGVAMWTAAGRLARTPRPGNRLPHPTGNPAVGVALAVTFALMVGAAWEPRYIPLMLLVALGLPAAYTDARELRLPDPLTYSLAAAAAVAVAVLATAGVRGSVLGAVVGGIGYPLVLLAVAVLTPTRATPGAVPAGSSGGTATMATTRPTALGLGDVKLALGVGIVAGWSSPATVTTALLLTAAGHLVWVIGCGIGRRAKVRSGLSGTALGPWMVAGCVAAVLVTAGTS